MSNKLDRLMVDHDFAPGAAPGAVQAVFDRLADIFISPHVALAFLGVLIPLALCILVKSQLREKTRRRRVAGPGACEARRTDFASIRRARMPGGDGRARPAADDAA